MEKKADHWSAEVEIPFSALGGSPDNGKYWLFHIGRENPGKNEVISWNLSSDILRAPRFLYSRSKHKQERFSSPLKQVLRQ